MLRSRRMLFTLMILAMAWAIRPVESAAFEEIDALFVLSGSRYADTLRAEEAIEAAGGVGSAECRGADGNRVLE